MGFRLPKTEGMLRREAATWLARLQSGRDPNVERKFRRWHDEDPRHAAAFERVRQSYDQAGLLRQSPMAVSSDRDAKIRKPEWQPRPALAAAAAIALLVPVAVLLTRGSVLPFGTDAVMLMTSVGEIKQIDLADGSKVTLDTSTKVEVEIGRSRRSAHLKYGRARFQIARAHEPFVVETTNSLITSREGVVDVERGAQQDRVQVLSGAAEVRGPDHASQIALGAGQGATVNAAGADKNGFVAPASDWTKGMLQFDGTSLGDAVAIANRYSVRHIILVGDLNSLRVTGAFRAGDTIGLAKALAAAFGLTLNQREDGGLVLSRSSTRAIEKNRG